MSQSIKVERHQTLGEEIANSISHGVGFLGALAVTPIMIVTAIPSGAAAIVGVSIFGTTMMLLYLASTLYHAFPQSRTKRVFKIFDHGAIFLLIAGTSRHLHWVYFMAPGVGRYLELFGRLPF
jgi:hemolysin III